MEVGAVEEAVVDWGKSWGKVKDEMWKKKGGGGWGGG